MPEQLTAAVKNRRAHEAKTVSEETRKDFLEASVGQTLEVLFESTEDGSLGHSDTYLHVRVPEQGLRGQLKNVRILRAKEDALFGEVV